MMDYLEDQFSLSCTPTEGRMIAAVLWVRR